MKKKKNLCIYIILLSIYILVLNNALKKENNALFNTKINGLNIMKLQRTIQ